MSVQDHLYLGTPLQVAETSVIAPQPPTVGQAGLPSVSGVVAATGHTVSVPAVMGIGVAPAPYGPAAYGNEPVMPAGAGSVPYEPVANGPTVNGPAHGSSSSGAGGSTYPLPTGNIGVVATGQEVLPFPLDP